MTLGAICSHPNKIDYKVVFSSCVPGHGQVRPVVQHSNHGAPVVIPPQDTQTPGRSRKACLIGKDIQRNPQPPNYDIAQRSSVPHKDGNALMPLLAFVLIVLLGQQIHGSDDPAMELAPGFRFWEGTPIIEGPVSHINRPFRAIAGSFQGKLAVKFMKT